MPINSASILQTSADAKWISLPSVAVDSPTMPLLMFLEKKFIPDHVELKSPFGRTHYHAILKHILRPETVDSLFAPYLGNSKGRLKSAPDWPYLDELRLCDLTADHLQQLTSSATAHGYSPQTVKHIKNVVSKIVSHAQKEGILICENPMKAVKVPPIGHKRNHTLTISQARAVIRLLKFPAREIALLIVSTGTTLSEISALRWKDVNQTGAPIRRGGVTISPHSIVIRKQWHMDGIGDVHMSRAREFRLPKPLINAIARLKRSSPAATPDDFVFVNHEGTPIRPADIRKLRLKHIGRSLDIPWLSWQVFRHAHEALLDDLRIKLASHLTAKA